MVIYFFLFIALWGLAFSEYVNKRDSRQKIPGLAAIVLAALYTSFRFETGNDWLPYYRIFDGVGTLFDTSLADYSILATDLDVELTYIILNTLLKTIVDDFQMVIVFTSLLYFYAFYNFLKNYTQYRATVIAVSYSWLVFTLYFSTISQSLAISFFLLFWNSYLRNRRIRYVIYGFLSLSFHLSAASYFLMFAISRIRVINQRLLVAALAVIMIMMVVGIDLGNVLLKTLQFLPSNYVEQKLNYYLEDRGLLRNIWERAFVLSFTLVVGGWLMFHPTAKNTARSPVLRQLYMFSLVYLILQGLLFEQVVFRNRLLYLSFPIVFIVLFEANAHQKLFTKATLVTGIFVVSMAYQVYFLTRPSSITFVPYQNYFVLKAKGENGDGYERTLEQLRSIIRK